MNQSELFQIGEVAKLFHLSVGTLRHYEQNGLLSPEYIDPNTGYRYYSAPQFEVLNLIRYLRVLDMPLPQIKEFLQNRDIEVIEEKLRQQKEIVIRKQKELSLIQRKIDNRLRQLEEARTAKLNSVYLEEFPGCRIAWMEDSVRPRTYLDLEKPIRKLDEKQKVPVAFIGKVGVGISKSNLEKRMFEAYDLVFFLLDEEDEYEGNIEIIPKQLCVTIRYTGSHVEAPMYYERLLNYAKENDLQINGFSREMTIIDYGITNDESKFLTEIRIPVY